MQEDVAPESRGEPSALSPQKLFTEPLASLKVALRKAHTQISLSHSSLHSPFTLTPTLHSPLHPYIHATTTHLDRTLSTPKPYAKSEPKTRVTRLNSTPNAGSDGSANARVSICTL